MNKIKELIEMINDNVKTEEKKIEVISYIWSDKLNSIMTGEDTNDLRMTCRECKVSIIDVLNNVRDNRVEIKNIIG